MQGLTDAGLKGREKRDGSPSLFRRLRPTLLVVGLFTLVGAAVPVAVQQFSDRQFRSETHLTIRDANPAVIRSAAERLRSRAVLDNLVRALNLGQRQEFSVNRPTILRIVSEVLSGEVTTMSQAEEAVRQRLVDAMSVTYDASRRQLVIGANAGTPQEAAAISSRLAEEFERAAVTAAQSRQSPQQEAMRSAAERAEAALSGFARKLGDDMLGRLQRFHDDSDALATEIAVAARNLNDLGEKQRVAEAMTLADVLSKPLPDSLEFTGLEYQRQRYAEAQIELERLSASLGPRHPKRAAAQATLDDAKLGVTAALRQLAASLKEQMGSAEQSVAELRVRQASMAKDSELAEPYRQLSTLQAAANEARRNLEQAERDSAARNPAILPSVQIDRAASAASAVMLPLKRQLVSWSTAGGAAVGLAIGLALAAGRYRHQMALADEAYEDAAIRLHHEQVRAEPMQSVAAARVDLRAEIASIDPPLDTDEGGQVEERYAANDTAFGDRMRDLLLQHSRPAADAALPSLLTAVIEESRMRRDSEPQIEQASVYDEKELRALQEELADLRELLRHEMARQYRATG